MIEAKAARTRPEPVPAPEPTSAQVVDRMTMLTVASGKATPHQVRAAAIPAVARLTVGDQL